LLSEFSTYQRKELLCQVIFVPPPDLEGRLEVLRIHTRRFKIGNDVSLEQLAKDTDCYTGAELAGLCRESGMVALRESLAADTVFRRHFDSAKASITPLLTPLQISSYANFNRGRLK
jgi:SpoVK/Ycf46/Vps4 family AAA+-type ATPase